ncbi:MAG TPA: hypothetical protein VEI97_00330 [bacterium]|nr:hypothetical protein [bacterium]
MPRRLSLLPLATLILAGCGSATLNPTAPSPSGTAEPGPMPAASYHAGGLTQATLGTWRIRVDRGSLAASTELLGTRVAQDNDDLYLLSINSFLGTETLNVRNVTLDSDSLNLTYAITHPFDAPTDLTAPATAANRADLGVAGMVTFLVDVPTAVDHTYFNSGGGDTVIAETGATANADGYFRPAGLLALPGYTANTFPYKLLVDELQDPRTNRLGAPVSNAGDPTGNYNPAAGGWQGANMGANRNGWTGYGVLHQGQVAINTLEIPLDYLGTADLQLTAAVIAKYNDPRQGATPAQRKANRLPANPVDVAKFAYRMPFGALDVERITVAGVESALIADEPGEATFYVHVADWDARATASTAVPLSADSAVDTVLSGTEGLPTVDASIPGMAATPVLLSQADDDTAFGGDAAPDSGTPGDALLYGAIFTKPGGTGEAPGTYVALVRATDPEAGSNPVTALDEGLAPLTGNFPEPVTYQAVPLPVAGPGWVHAGFGTGDEYGFDVHVDGQGNALLAGQYYGTVDLGQGPLTSAGASDGYVVKTNRVGQVQWARSFGAVGQDLCTGVATDAAGNVYVAGHFSGTVDFGNGPLTALGSIDPFLLRLSPAGVVEWAVRWGSANTENYHLMAVAAGGTSVYSSGAFSATFDSGAGTLTSAGGFDMYLRETNALTGSPVWAARFGGASGDEPGGVAATPTGSVVLAGDFSGTATFATAPRTSAGGVDGVVMQITPGNTVAQWDRVVAGDASDRVTGAAVDSAGNVVIGGFTQSTAVNFGAGARPRVGTIDGFVARYTSGGGLLWDDTFGGSGASVLFRGVATGPASQVVATGNFTGTVDFGAGPRAAGGSDDTAIVQLTAGGVFEFDRVLVTASLGEVIPRAGVAVDPNAGAILAGGEFNRTVDFDPGPGITERTSPGGSHDPFLVRLGATGNW